MELTIREQETYASKDVLLGFTVAHYGVLQG